MPPNAAAAPAEFDPATARVAISIVSYRTADMVAEALPALMSELDRFAEAAVFVVDNLSPGDDADRMAAHLARIGDPRIRLIRSDRNGGFAAGNNLAFAAARDLPWTPEAVLLLNPDAEMRPGALVEMMRVMRSAPKIGVVGARLAREDGSGLSAAFRFPSAMGEFARGAGLSVFLKRWPVMEPDLTVPTRVDWITGAAMLIRAEVLETVGDMDEEYFLYFEEIDYMLQATRAGWQVWHAPQAVIMHAAGAATGIVGGVPVTGRMPEYWFDSWNRYFEKNHGAFYARAAAAAKIAGLWIGAAQRGLRGRARRVAPGFVGAFARRCLLGAPARGGR